MQTQAVKMVLEQLQITGEMNSRMWRVVDYRGWVTRGGRSLWRKRDQPCLLERDPPNSQKRKSSDIKNKMHRQKRMAAG